MAAGGGALLLPPGQGGARLTGVLGLKARAGSATARPGRYKWVVLSNTTLGVLMATIDLSIMLIALPDIFRGIGLDPLAPATASTCCG
jgi:hypothetical protein